ncbi:THAP domain-containing protein [Phthorimaea operculella]|nr:THAP domain-containing protein [Phthorimaea operculella]
MADRHKNHRTCEICGYQEKRTSEKLFYARFPLNEFRCKEWVRVVGKEDLTYLPIEKLHELKHVCGKHFQKKDFTKTGTRLKKRAVPKLHLTATPLNEKMLVDFPLHRASVSLERNLEPQPGTSKTMNVTVAATEPDGNVSQALDKTSVTMHSFPTINRLEQLKKWVDLVGGKLESPADYEYYKRARVCDKHFVKQDYNRCKRLNALAVPTLHLSMKPQLQATVTTSSTGITDSLPPSPTTHRAKMAVVTQPCQRPASCSRRLKNSDTRVHWLVRRLGVPHEEEDRAIQTPISKNIVESSKHNSKENLVCIKKCDPIYGRRKHYHTEHPYSKQAPPSLAGSSNSSKDDGSASSLNQNTDGVASLLDQNTTGADDDIDDQDEKTVFSWQKPAEAIHDDAYALDPPDQVPSMDIEVDSYSQEQDQEMFPKHSDWALTVKKEPSVAADDMYHDYKCNICSNDISGFRYVCVQCVDLDLCAACESRGEHDQHYVLRVPQLKPHSEVSAVLRTIRRALVMDAIVDMSTLTSPDVVEVKQELEDPIAQEHDMTSVCDINGHQDNQSIPGNEPLDSSLFTYGSHKSKIVNFEMDSINSENETLDTLDDASNPSIGHVQLQYSSSLQFDPLESNADKIEINMDQNSPKPRKSKENSVFRIAVIEDGKNVLMEESTEGRLSPDKDCLEEHTYSPKKRKTIRHGDSLHTVTYLKPRLPTSSRFEKNCPSTKNSIEDVMLTTKEAHVVLERLSTNPCSWSPEQMNTTLKRKRRRIT